MQKRVCSKQPSEVWKKYRATLISARLTESTTKLLNNHLEWLRGHVCKARRYKKGTLAAICLDQYLPKVIADDKKRHLARAAAATVE